MMSYRHICTIVSLVFFTLMATLVLAPDIIYWLFNVQGNAESDFLAKRAGMLFLGLSILCFYARNTNSTEVESVVAVSVGTAMAAMAVLGVYELVRSNAGAGILLAIAAEILIAALFYRVWFSNRQRT